MAESRTNTGLFNFQSIMNQFYNWTPDGDDTAGQALKNTFLADNVQSVLNNQMAKDLAYTNAEIATGQMATAAQLELANQTKIMDNEFKYGMEKMGAEYDYQSRFATDEANRKLNQTAMEGDVQQGQTKVEGAQQRKIDTNRGDIERQNLKTQGQVDIKKTRVEGDETRKTNDAQGYLDRKLTKVKGKQDRKLVKTQGKQDRKNMEQETIEAGKTAARQSSYANQLASKF